MKWHTMRLFGVVLSLVLITSCGQKSQRGQKVVDSSSVDAETKKELPINVVIKRNPAQVPRYTSAPDIEDTSVAPGPAVPPPPFPVPFPPVLIPPLVEDDRDDREDFVDDESCRAPFCGNGIKEDDEQCDDGNDDNGDQCDLFCRIPVCGNGIIEGEEECDNPNNINCTETCTLPLCGNSVINQGETCDPPNSQTCNYTCKLSVCGNNIVELGEQCDDGNMVTTDGCDSCQISCPATISTKGRR